MYLNESLELEKKQKIFLSHRLLKQTESICPKCLEVIPARITTDEKAVYLTKECHNHGSSRGIIWNDLALYQKAHMDERPDISLETVSKESPFYYGLMDRVATRSCLAILEITSQCNTNCPICIADTPKKQVKPPLALKQIERVTEVLRDTVGTTRSIQLSGGEPTIHDDIIKIVELIRNQGFENLAMDSNGTLLARKPELAKALKSAGMTGVFLQFDGFSSLAYQKIRGSDLLDEKLRAIESCQKAGLSMVLQPTVVKGVNFNELWAIVQFAVNLGVGGVDFLPFTPSGRHPSWGSNPLERTTLDEIISGIEEQSGGKLRADDFYSIPTLDPRCAVISYMLIREGELVPLTRLVDYAAVKNHYEKLSDWETVLTDLAPKPNTQSCCSPSFCCKPSPYDLSAKGYFVVGCHCFQDKWNFDLERARYCCFHELTPEGKLVPFCWYNIIRKANPKK